MTSKISNCLVLICLVFVFSQFYSCFGHNHGHGHHHGHSHEESEPPAFKYSRNANEKVVHHSEHHHEHVFEEKTKEVQSASQLWLNAMGSTLLISAAPFFILFFVPLDNTKQKQPLLNILLAFASGGLLGDAFLHLIPHATMAVEDENPHSHSHSHSHESADGEGHAHDMSVGLLVLAGIVTFLILEKVVRILKGGHTHSHSHSPPATKEKESKPEKKTPKKEETKITKKEENDKKEIKVAGYLNLVADFSHNFTDGLAIGSSYLAGSTIGMVTTLTILLHEVPHEIGDFAILLQSGVSRRNAMLLQLVTAFGALAGTAISLFAHNTAETLAFNSSFYILPFTAGGFIYIALVSVLPELLAEENPTFFQTILQVIAMLAGVYMMVLIAEFE